MQAGRAVLSVDRKRQGAWRAPWSAYLWLAMMLAWLAALAYGAWWVWPHVERLALTSELIGSLIWLSMGAVAWVVALRFGLQRYWRR